MNTPKMTSQNKFDDYSYLIEQLNSLIVFLMISNEKNYNDFKKNRYLDSEILEEMLNYQSYYEHIVLSAFLMGFNYFENFITKIVTKILLNNPKLLRRRENLSYVNSESFIIEKAKKLTFSEKINLIDKQLVTLDSELLSNLKYVNSLRNCIVHNDGIANKNLKQHYKKGQKISLDKQTINFLGIQARALANQIQTKTLNL